MITVLMVSWRRGRSRWGFHGLEDSLGTIYLACATGTFTFAVLASALSFYISFFTHSLSGHHSPEKRGPSRGGVLYPILHLLGEGRVCVAARVLWIGTVVAHASCRCHCVAWCWRRVVLRDGIMALCRWCRERWVASLHGWCGRQPTCYWSH